MILAIKYLKALENSTKMKIEKRKKKHFEVRNLFFGLNNDNEFGIGWYFATPLIAVYISLIYSLTYL